MRFASLLRLLLLPFVAASCDELPGPPAPPLVASQPAEGAVDVPTTAWLHLEFGARVPSDYRTLVFDLACEGDPAPRGVDTVQLSLDALALSPKEPLPADRACTLRFATESGPEAIGFRTAAAGAPLRVLHDRSDPDRVGPYPDDVRLVADPTTRTGWRHDVPLPTPSQNHTAVFGALLAEANRLDGFSPVGPMIVELDDAVDPATVPRTPAESLEPTASVALVDLTPWSASFGQRVPFRIDVRNGDATVFGLVSNTLVLFPSIPLEPEGRYGLLVTNRVRAAPGRPLAPSAWFEAVLADPVPGEDPLVTRHRAHVDEVLDVAGHQKIRRGHLAYAARITVRSTWPIQDDVQVMKRHVLAADPPAVSIDPADPDAVEAEPGEHVAALVRGTWQAPDWRDGLALARDAAGRPAPPTARPVCFRLALPEAALDGPVPVVVYQHGNPGESETEVLRNAERFLARAGYAVVGFTDTLNRDVAPPASTPGPACIHYEDPEQDDEERITAQVTAIVLNLLLSQRIPDYWSQTLGEQLAFVRMVQGLDGLDLLPLGAPDGVPDLDPSQLFYMGISEGANNGQAFVAYAPEVRAAALVVGGARLAEVLLHQQAETFLGTLPLLFPALSPGDIWTALALFQADFDRQDKHNHGRFVFRRPIAVPRACDDLATCLAPDYCDAPGACTTRKPNLLVTEGLDDSLVPNHATESAAWQLGLPHLAPVQREVPFLRVKHDRVHANVDKLTTAAFYQFVPDGVPGVPITPGCQSPPLSERSSTEGHFCAQSAVESRAQRLMFFDSALGPERRAATIVDPLPFYPEGTPLFPVPVP